MGRNTFGLKGCRISISALYADLDGFLWAMACLREMRLLSVRIETDCASLIKMTEIPLDWPAFNSELAYFCNLRNNFEFLGWIILLGVKMYVPIPLQNEVKHVVIFFRVSQTEPV